MVPFLELIDSSCKGIIDRVVFAGRLFLILSELKKFYITT